MSSSYDFDPELQICSYMPGRGPCNGDSGGPALLEKDESFFSVIYFFFVLTLSWDKISIFLSFTMSIIYLFDK